VLQQAESVTIVPEQALTKRDGQDGVFVLDAGATRVSWRPVTIGIRQSQRAAIDGQGIEGRVVVLGQQLLDDGSAITIAGEEKAGKP
jgi:multidrug efflux pump subunit AcrA (membrane-fusion protein)